MLRGCPLASWCCMCCCDGESVDHLLLHCPVTHSLWTFMIQAFGIRWIMPGSVAGLLSCWHQWLGNLNSDIWNLVPGCLMWIVWLERNRRSFEDNKKTLDELKVLCQRSLFEWSRCWGFTDCSTLSEFYRFLFTYQKKKKKVYPQERKPQNHYITCIDGGLSCAFNSLTADWKYKNKSGLRRSENNMQVMNILKKTKMY